MANVEEELWNIFTFYTLHGNPLGLNTLSVTHFLRLAKDCQIVDAGATPRASAAIRAGQAGKSGQSRRTTDGRKQQREHRLGQAAVNLAFASVIQQRAQTTSNYLREKTSNDQSPFPSMTAEDRNSTAAVKSKLTYPEFLDALAMLSERMYGQTARRYRSSGAAQVVAAEPSGGTCCGRSTEDAFQQLLMENVLPLASRRRPSSVVAAVRDPLVLDIFQHYGPALREMFRFYAESSSSCVASAENHRTPNDGTGSTTASTTTSTRWKKRPVEAEASFPSPPVHDLEATSSNICSSTPGRPEESEPNETLSPLFSPPTQPPTPPTCPTLPTPPTSPTPPSPPTTTVDPPETVTDTIDTKAAQMTPNIEPHTTAGFDGTVNSTRGSTTSMPSPPPPPSSCCAASTASCSSRRRAAYDGSGRPGVGGGNGGQKERRRRRRAQGGIASGSAMNSMADALSHTSLLCFAADFGISGALVSTLELGEIFLSCREADTTTDEVLKHVPHDAALRPTTVPEGQRSYCLGEDDNRADSAWTQSAWRTALARTGQGMVRPLSYLGFQEALVRIALACFCPRKMSVVVSQENESREDSEPGTCLRALLTYMWRRLHASVQLALNGVCAGGAKHRSSIQKGALLRGVQLFNDRMLSRWRAEGFLDLATTPSTTLSSSTRIPSRRKGRGSNILRKILALDDNIDGDDDDYDKSHRAGSGVVGVSERGIESRGRLPDVITNADTTLPVVGTTNTEEQHKNEGLVEGIGCRERAIVVATAAGIVSSSAAPVGRQQH